MTHDWISLEYTPTTLVRLLPDLAGGLTLQLLTATEQAGQTFALTHTARRPSPALETGAGACSQGALSPWGT